MLLILDLDETLIHTTTAPLRKPPDFAFDEFLVYRRPRLDRFLAFAEEHFTVAVWTSSSPDYAAEIVRNIFPAPDRLAFVWARDRCTPRLDWERYGMDWLKPLKKVKRLGFPLEEMIAVDDSPEKYIRNYGNLVRVAPFVGDSDDDELLRLERYLLVLKELPDVRAVEKRWWRVHPAVTGRTPDGSSAE
jgi:carboxy-terminal domain RNA polymerase II polypeptide A small phosphatase